MGRTASVCLLCFGLMNLSGCDAERARWHGNTRVTLLKLDDFTFDSAETRERLLRWEAAAAGIHSKSWHYQPWYQSAITHDYPTEWWSSVPQHVFPDGEPARHLWGETAAHFVRLSCSRGLPTKLFLSAIFKTKKEMLFNFSCTSQGDDVELKLSNVFHRQGMHKDIDIEIYPGQIGWNHETTFERVHYDFEVNIESPSVNVITIPVAKKLLSKWTLTPESLVQRELELIDQLEEAIWKEIASGHAIKDATITRVLWENVSFSSIPPETREEPSERKLTFEEKGAVLESALQEMERRRSTVIHYRSELESSMQKIFPVDALFSTTAGVAP